jgi:hypothetical protein
MHLAMRDTLPPIIILPFLALEAGFLLCVLHRDEAPYDHEEERDGPAIPYAAVGGTGSIVAMIVN